jgi:hypothetical protein
MDKTMFEKPIELTDAELDAVAAGSDNDLVDVDIQDVNVNANVLTGPVINFNA